MRKITFTLAILSLSVLGACAGADEDLGAVADTATDEVDTLLDEVDPLVDEAQDQVADLRAEIESADLPEEARAAWDAANREIDSAFAALRENAEIDTAALRQRFDAFQESLEGADVEAAVTEAWNEIRTTVEQLLPS